MVIVDKGPALLASDVEVTFWDLDLEIRTGILRFQGGACLHFELEMANCAETLAVIVTAVRLH